MIVAALLMCMPFLFMCEYLFICMFVVQFEKVVNLENPDLMQWLFEGRPLPADLETNRALVNMIHYARNEKKSWHIGAGNQNI